MADRGTETTERELDELIGLCDRHEDADGLVDALELGVELFPRELKYVAGLGIFYLNEREYPEAEIHLRELVERLGEKREVRPPGINERVPKSARSRLEKKLTPELAATLDDETVALDYRISKRCPYRSTWSIGRVPGIVDARLALALCLAKDGQREEAVDLIRRHEPVHPGYIQTSAFLAGVYGAIQSEEAQRLIDSVAGVLELVDEQPALCYRRHWNDDVRAVMAHRSELARSDGRLGEAYVLTRRYGSWEMAEPLIPKDVSELAALLRAQFLAALNEPVNPTRLYWSTAIYGELLTHEGSHAGAAEAYAACLEHLPGEFLLREALARALQDAGARYAAITVREEAIRLREEEFERLGHSRADMELLDNRYYVNSSSSKADPMRVNPLLKGGNERAQGRSAHLAVLSQAASWSNDPKQPWVAHDRTAILQLAFAEGDYKRAAEELRWVSEHVSSAGSWYPHIAREVVGAPDAALALPVLRAIDEHAPLSGDVGKAFGELLDAGGDEESALAVYTRLLRQNQLEGSQRDEVASRARELREAVEANAQE